MKLLIIHTPLEIDIWEFIKVGCVINAFDFHGYGSRSVSERANSIYLTVNIAINHQQRYQTLSLGYRLVLIPLKTNVTTNYHHFFCHGKQL